MCRKAVDHRDPVEWKSRPVVGLRIPYATAVVAGGLGRALPNQWEMNGKLRKIPDSVEEFTGFQKGMDALGGDLLGQALHEAENTRSRSV